MKRTHVLPAMVFAALLSCVVTDAAWSATFTIGVEETDYLPIYNGAEGGYTGYARELLDTFGKEYKHQFVYKPLPIKRLFDEFATKKTLDFKFPDNPQWQTDIKKNSNVMYSSPAVVVTEGLLVLPANKGKGIKSITKIGTLRGFTPWPYMDLITAKKIIVNEANSANASIEMTKEGRIDGAYLNTISANYIMGDIMKKPGILVLDETLPNNKSDFSLASIAHPVIIKQFNEFLVKEKDAVAKLKAKYKIIE